MRRPEVAAAAVEARAVLVAAGEREEPQSPIERLCEDLLDVVLDKAPLWFLVGLGVLAVVGVPFWVTESLS